VALQTESAHNMATRTLNPSVFCFPRIGAGG